MSSIEKTVDLLNSIDWNFPRSGTLAKSVHSFHWFPGNFIPQIPAHFIQILSKPGDIVLDPFGGSGTTAIEAARLGRHGISSDYLNACCFVATGKLAGHRAGLTANDKRAVLNQLAWPELCETSAVGTAGEGTSPELSHWYSEKTLARLRYLWRLIEAAPPHVRAVLELIFSDVLFACASTGASRTKSGKIRRHHWGWIADNVHPIALLDHEVIELFASRIAAFPELPTIGSSDTAVAVLRQDARKLAIANDSIDLVVTSPPYVSVIDYARANRLLYLWKGWNMSQERSSEIGARFKRSRQAAVQDYLAEMTRCWSEMHRVLKRGSFLAVVIGESKRFPGTVDAALGELSKILQPAWGPVARTPARRRISDTAGMDPTEYLAVFVKQC